MKILGFVVIRERDYARTLDGYNKKIEDLEVKVGALEFENRRLNSTLMFLRGFWERV